MSTYRGNSPRTGRETDGSEPGPDGVAPGSFGRNGHGSAEAWPEPQDDSTTEVGPVDPSTWHTEQPVQPGEPDGSTAIHNWSQGHDDVDQEAVPGVADDQPGWAGGPVDPAWGVGAGPMPTEPQAAGDSWNSGGAQQQGRYEFSDYPSIGGDAMGAQPSPMPTAPPVYGDAPAPGDGRPAPPQVPQVPQGNAAEPEESSEPVRVTKTGKAPRKAHLQVARFEPWSVMKFSFVMSLVCFIVFFVAVFVLHLVLSGLGVFDAISTTITDVTAGPPGEGGAAVDPASWFALPRVLGYTALLGAVNVLLITALATVWAVIYNMASDLVGGVEVTLEEAE